MLSEEMSCFAYVQYISGGSKKCITSSVSNMLFLGVSKQQSAETCECPGPTHMKLLTGCPLPHLQSFNINFRIGWPPPCRVLIGAWGPQPRSQTSPHSTVSLNTRSTGACMSVAQGSKYPQFRGPNKRSSGVQIPLVKGPKYPQFKGLYSRSSGLYISVVKGPTVSRSGKDHTPGWSTVYGIHKGHTTTLPSGRRPSKQWSFFQVTRHYSGIFFFKNRHVTPANICFDHLTHCPRSDK